MVHFKKPHIQRVRVKRNKIKRISILNTITPSTSISDASKWWDYLLDCENTTKTDRAEIYWKYKYFFGNTPIDDILTKKFYELPQHIQHLLTKIHRREIKKLKCQVLLDS